MQLTFLKHKEQETIVTVESTWNFIQKHFSERFILFRNYHVAMIVKGVVV